MANVIESKVSWSTLATLAASIAVAVLNGYSANNNLIPGLPSYLQPILILIVPTLVTFLTGYSAPHTSRPDLQPAPQAADGAYSVTALGEPISEPASNVAPVKRSHAKKAAPPHEHNVS